MDQIGRTISGIVAAVIALAVLAVIVGAGSNSVNVIRAFFSGMAGLLGVAISPATGSNVGAFAGQQLAAGSGIGNSGSSFGSVPFGGSSTLGGSLGVATPGFAFNLSGLGQTIGGISNLFGSSGGTGGGFIDSGGFDLGGAGDAAGLVDTTSGFF